MKKKGKGKERKRERMKRIGCKNLDLKYFSFVRTHFPSLLLELFFLLFCPPILLSFNSKAKKRKFIEPDI